MEQARGKFLIVDGHAYAYRAFYAIRNLSGPGGQPTNAIYGFIKMLGKLRGVVQPTHWAVVWDGGLAEERRVSLPEYKAQRPAIPSSLENQIVEIGLYLDSARVPSFTKQGIEADDWIATMARCALPGGVQVVIASSDKDFMQLVSDRIGLFNPNNKTESIWTRDRVVAKTGVAPEQIVDWLSLIGDAVDNIPGVPGVGTKTAAELLRQFGSVDGLYSRLSEVKSAKLRVDLARAEGLVRRNQQLIRLREDIPCRFRIEQCAIREPDDNRLRELYGRWGFKVLLRELEEQRQRQKLLFEAAE